MKCDNCGKNSKFKKVGFDELNNIILECQECGAISYEDGTLIEEDEEIVLH